MRLVLCALLALGCGPRPAPIAGAAGRSAQPQASPVAPAKAPPPSGPPAPELLRLTLVPRPAPAQPASLPRLEIVEPSFGDTLDPRFARKQPVRVRAEAAWLGAEGEGVLVSLDGGRPRRVLADSAFTLGDFLSADQPLAEGPHVLVALAVTADGRAIRAPSAAPVRPLAVVGFFVGPRVGEPASAATPALFCLSPTGTHYLKPDAGLPFEVFAVGWEPRALALRVRAQRGEFEAVIDPSQSYSVYGTPSGDLSFSIGAEPGPRAACVATVNLAGGAP